MQYTLFRSVRLPDHTVTDLWCRHTAPGITGQIVRCGSALSLSAEEAAHTAVVDAACQIAIPPLVDLHSHLCEPGFAYRETVRSACAAARAGGFGTLCAVPDERSPLDAVRTVEFLRSAARGCQVLPIAPAFTKDGRCEDYPALLAAGAVAFSDHTGSAPPELRLEAMRRLARLDALLLLTCRVPALSHGVMQEGKTASLLHVSGISKTAETVAVAEAVALCEATGCRVHLSTVTTKESFAMLRSAKARGVRITCEVAPPYFWFSDTELLFRGAAAKLDPPLRAKSDVEATIEAILDGTVDVIASDHSPRAQNEKLGDLSDALPGACGLETAFAASYTRLVEAKLLSLPQLISLLRDAPMRILRLPKKAAPFTPGAPADFSLLSPNEVEISAAHFLSRARNTPFEGLLLSGMPTRIIRGGVEG